MSCGSFRERRRENIFSVSLHLKDLITIEIIYRNALNVKRYTGRSTFVGIVFFLALWPAKAASERSAEGFDRGLRPSSAEGLSLGPQPRASRRSLVRRVTIFIGFQFVQHRRIDVEIEAAALTESGDDPMVTKYYLGASGTQRPPSGGAPHRQRPDRDRLHRLRER